MADAADDTLNCGSGGGADTYFSLRVASIFIILIGSSCGALFPVLAKRSSWLHVPKGVFEYVGFVSDFCPLLTLLEASRSTLDLASSYVASIHSLCHLLTEAPR